MGLGAQTIMNWEIMSVGIQWSNVRNYTSPSAGKIHSSATFNGEWERQPVLKELIKEPISLKSSDFYSLIQYCTIFSLVIAILFNEQNGEFRIPGIIPFKNRSGDLSVATVTTAIPMETMMATRVVVSASAECSSSSRDQNVAQSKENMILSLIIYHLMPHKIK